MKKIFYYDENKIMNGVDLVDDNFELPTNATDVIPPNGLYKAQFTGTEWVETITNDELLEINKVEKIISDTERIEALEGALIEITEMLL